MNAETYPALHDPEVSEAIRTLNRLLCAAGFNTKSTYGAADYRFEAWKCECSSADHRAGLCTHEPK